MKASRFNKVVEIESGNRLLFNADTGAIAELPPESYSNVKKLLFAPAKAETAEDRKLVDQLLYGGFLSEPGFDEIAHLKVENGRHRFGNPLGFIGIAPTFECNLTCGGCSSRNQKGRMTKLVEKAALKFVARQIKKCDELQVCWFGGEPLLGIETIERLHRGIAESAAKYDTTLQGSTIITNGYLLDAKMAKRLKEAGVTGAQVTLEGPPEIHDSRRKLPDGTGTFDTVLGNIAAVAEELDIVVRISVLENDPEAAVEVVEILEKQGLLSKIGFYFGPAESGCDACDSVVGQCRLDDKEVEVQLGIYRRLAESVSNRMDYPYLIPFRRCGFDSSRSFLVAPTGYVFKCWEQASARVDDSVCNVFGDDPESFQQSNQWRFTAFDPFDSSECVKCDILPVCMGGCPIAIEDRSNMIKSGCSPWRKNLEELLVLRYLYELREEVI
ncbi:MAG: SPASM domain-containing protein [Candidatus Zixiibacteriota bacterium]|nr:MAG: SPASM domain-containing protein [candidate division Zixibacteria bacterium]